MVLDGGLATALEDRGFDLHDELWSAKLLLDAPEVIRQVHLDFLLAGADCITTSSYQASFAGFRRRGLDESAAVRLLELSVNLAIEARDLFWSDPANRQARLRPLVAASVGPYGAFMADGSEYTGRYDVSDSGLYEFHRRRWQVLAQTRADLLACETIPTEREARVLLDLLRETPGRWAWMSFCCRDEHHLSDGSRLSDVVRTCDAESGVVAVGINCTSPEFISSLVDEARAVTEKPILVYPNSGERFDALAKTWRSSPSPVNWKDEAMEWTRRGAVAVGGCCRVGAGRIAEIRDWLVQ